MGGDVDRYVGPFISPECPGHRDYIGGGKNPPPTVPPVQHAGALAIDERAEYCHHLVRQRMTEEEMQEST